MSLDLRANTAVDVLIGPFVDSTDGNTTEDGLTISQADVKLSKNGQPLAQKNDVTTCAFDDDGYYNCELDSTDLNTEGGLVLIVHESGALPVRHEFNVMAEAAWDSLYIAKDDGFMDVNIKTIGRTDTQETEANNLEAACATYSVTRGLTGTAVPAAAADGAGGLPISDAGGLDLDTILARITANVATEAKQDIIDTNVDAVLVDTGTILPLEHAALPTAVENRQEMDSNSTELAKIDLQATLAICTEARLSELDAANLPTDIADIPTVAEFEARTIVAADYFDPTADTVALVTDVTTKTGYALSAAGVDLIWNDASAITLDFGTLVERIYQMLNNRETVVDASGNVAYRTIGNGADLATCNISDDDTTTIRTENTWV